MSVLKPKNSKFYQIRFTYKGKLYAKSSRSQNKKLAEQMERQMKDQLISNEELGIKKTITCQKAFENLLKKHKDRGGYKQVFYCGRAAVDFIGGDKQLDKVNSGDLERLILDRQDNGSKPTTINHIIATFRQIVNYADRMNYKIPVLKYPKVHNPNKRIKYMSIEQEQRLLEELSPDKQVKGANRNTSKLKQDNYDFALLLIDTGMRYSEAANLKISDISLDFGTIKLYRSKVDNESILHMSNRVKQMLTRRLQQATTQWVFTNRQGDGPRSHSTGAIMKAMKRAGLDGWTVHDIRHSTASKWAQNGMSLQEIAMLLGHSSTQMSARYAHLLPNATFKKAAAIIDKQVNEL